MRHLQSSAPAALALALFAAGCSYEPTGPELSYSLNPHILTTSIDEHGNEVQSDLYNADLAADRTAQAQILGALGFLFGSPSAPGYMRPEDWIDDEYDPNYGDADLGDAEWEALVADNEARFAKELEAIEHGRYEDLVVPREALDLRARWEANYLEPWRELAAAVEAGEAEQSELDELAAGIQEDAPWLFREWYPTLRESAELYRVQCYHCHGVEGGGDGPTAEFLSPRPRDYRRGIFKFTALNNKARPRRDDLYRTLEEGVYGTAMPSFARLSRAELHGLVDYVRLLAIRGETEIRLAADYDRDEGLPLEVVEETYLDVWDKWDTAADELIVYEGQVPRPSDSAIAHGRELFMDPSSANCFSCHGPDGKGGGPSSKEPDPVTGEQVWRKDDWGNPIQPRDLTRGTYRFGRRPIDLFRRVYAGINGTPMPSHSSLKGPDGERLLTDEDLWDIVHYVRSLSSSEGHGS